MGAGVLFLDQQKRVMILRTSYKEHWEIPGGVVEADESPRQAASREVFEEIGLSLAPENLELLVVDYMAGNAEITEALMFVFFGGVLGPEIITGLSADKGEIVEWVFMEPGEALPNLGPRLGPRVARCMKALELHSAQYFEAAY